VSRGQENRLGAAVQGVEGRGQFGIHSVAAAPEVFSLPSIFRAGNQRFGGRRVLDILEQLVDVAQQQRTSALNSRPGPGHRVGVAVEWLGILSRRRMMTGVKPATRGRRSLPG